MRSLTGRFTLLLAGSALVIGAIPGCGTGLTLDSTLADALNVLTSGDLASAFEQFVAAADGGRGGLTDDQIAAIEALQAELDAGTLDGASFADSVEEIIGDRAPAMAFGGFRMGGGPFGMHRPHRLGDALELTEEQQAEAEVIFEDLHTTIADLRTQAKEDIRGLLTEEQLETLDGLKMGDDEATGRHFGRPGHHGSFASQFAELLDLTEEQQAAIDVIRTALREDVQAAHEAAREAFRAILTDEQLAILDAHEHGHGDDEVLMTDEG